MKCSFYRQPWSQCLIIAIEQSLKHRHLKPSSQEGPTVLSLETKSLSPQVTFSKGRCCCFCLAQRSKTCPFNEPLPWMKAVPQLNPRSWSPTDRYSSVLKANHSDRHVLLRSSRPYLFWLASSVCMLRNSMRKQNIPMDSGSSSQKTGLGCVSFHVGSRRRATWVTKVAENLPLWFCWVLQF